MKMEDENKDTSKIYIDEKDPEGPSELKFPARDVIIKRGINVRQDFDLLTEIGRGKFGTVYKCKEKETGLELASKFVPIPKREDRRNVEREVGIMNSLQHHLIIQLYAAYEYQKMMCVVLELVEGGELFDRVIDDDFVLTEKACVVFMRQICEAMQFVHKNNILHLDMKPENILCLTRDGNRIKIIDFGLARKFDPDKKLQILFGTPEFVAPEVVNFDCISYGTDMWSVGVICYVLLSGLSPFMGETDIETMANVTIAKYDFDDEAFSNVSSDALDFITKLLVKDISTRMTAAECLEHKWLKRRPKPPIPPKPLYTPPPKFITTSPTPPRETQPVELETTKDNLKDFIERWEEHPNSPYVFDNSTNVITPLLDSRGDSNSLGSSRVCSPSPCDSISTTPEETESQGTASPSEPAELPTISESPKQDALLPRSFKDYLHSFDRRKSDTGFILGKNAQSERINLADEIRKLSDHLLMLSEINTKLERETSNSPSDLKLRPTQNAGDPIAPTAVKSNRFVESTKSSTKGWETKSTATVIRTQSNQIVKTVHSQNSTKTPTMAGGQSRVSMLTLKLQSLDETPRIARNGKHHTENLKKMAKLENGFKETIEASLAEKASELEKGRGVPWPVRRRTKFRVNESSRDVPLGSPNTHQPFNLEDANTTKDCLLHLLEKYHKNSKAPPSGVNGRHSSISFDWNLADNLEQRTISSISAFFRKHATNGRNVQTIRAQLETKSSQ